MKYLVIIVALSVLGLGCQEGPQEKKSEVAEKPNKVNLPVAEKSVLRHVVLFKFKDDAPTSEVEKVEAAFADLPNHIDAIIDFEWGTNNSPEAINQGLTHCFLVTFADEAGREAYLPHPKHKAFVDMLGPVLDKVTVVDYWSK